MTVAEIQSELWIRILSDRYENDDDSTLGDGQSRSLARTVVAADIGDARDLFDNGAMDELAKEVLRQAQNIYILRKAVESIAGPCCQYAGGTVNKAYRRTGVCDCDPCVASAAIRRLR